MTEQLLYREAAAPELITRAQPDGVANVTGRRLDLRLYAWGDVAENTDEGIREQLMPGVFAGVDPTRVTVESQRHGGAIVGVGEAIVERSEGIFGTFRVAETPAGDELLALVTPGPEGEAPVLRDVSIVFIPQGHRVRGGIVQRTAGDLRRVAIVERGAYPSGAVLAARSDNPMDPCQHDGCELEATAGGFCADHQPAAPATPPPAPAAAPVQRADPELAAWQAGIDERVAQLATLAAVPGASLEAHPLATFKTLADFTSAVWRGEADPGLVARSAAEQVPANNPGVLPPAWIMDVKRIVDLGRRAITAFGGPKALAATGMEVDWPYLNSSNTLVGAQTNPLDEGTTARVDIAKGSQALATYTGYSQLAYQLLQRSSPSYREAYNRILLAAWGAVTDAAFCAALESGASGAVVTRGMLGTDVTLSTSAAADNIIDATAHGFAIGDAVVFTALTGGTGLTAGRVYWVTGDSHAANTFRVAEEPGGASVEFSTNVTAGTVAELTDTGQRLRTALAQASVKVEDATGQPASIALASTDLFLAFAGLSGIVPSDPAGNPSNASGTMLASTLRVEVSGLLIQRAPGVSAGKLLASNQEAADWHEDGPRFVTSEDVAKLGQNVGVYSYSAPSVYVPAGVVEMTFV